VNNQPKINQANAQRKANNIKQADTRSPTRIKAKQEAADNVKENANKVQQALNNKAIASGVTAGGTVNKTINLATDDEE